MTRQRHQQQGQPGGDYSNTTSPPTSRSQQHAPNQPHGHAPSHYPPPHPPQQQYQQAAGPPQQNGGHSKSIGKQQLHPNAEIALNQKNHRLAKELSDLRVRHREETRVVSRLTMENMNLASRCREAISQVAALKKELSVFQKRQSEWGTLQREVMLLRKQMDKNATSALEATAATASVTSSGGNFNHSSDLQKQHPQLIEKGSLESPNKRNNSPATDLDRIMSQQFRKQADEVVVPHASVNMESTALSITTRSIESVGKNNGNKKVSISIGSRSSFNSNTNDIEPSMKMSITYPHKMLTSSTNNKPTSSNVKIPINVNPTQNDDEFDADVDMVDFFAKSNSGFEGDSLSTSLTSESLLSSESSRLGNPTNHARKLKTSTDDRMPGDVNSPSQTGLSSPKNTKTPSLPGDNLLSSLDAFEASFASAFPETSFSITSETPLSSAKLNMSFDVPDFDPFFKSPSNKDASSSIISGAAGGDHSDHAGIFCARSNRPKSHVQDLFPDSAMNFKSNQKVDMAFDSTPMAFGLMKVTGPSEPKKMLTPVAQLDATFSSIQVKGKSNISSAESKEEKPAPKHRGAIHQNPHASPLSPESMTAEIEQLDVIANLALSEQSESPNAANPITSRTTREQRAVRKVKQPVSYAEPSTKSKLRRGDVLFPKIDAVDKKATQCSDLDRIMSQKMSDD